jgi:tetratricopeptide (TPR) repeat protein
MQSFLEKAIENYTASLKYIPDAKVEQRIKELKTALDGRKKYLENVRLSKKVRTEGDQLIKEARSEQSFEASQDKFSKGLDKYKESLKLYSPPDVAILNQTIYAVESDKQGRIVSKYRADGEALEREGRIVDALAAYQKAYASYHVSVPQTDRMQLQVKIQELTNRINGAKTWRAQGETQQKQGKVAEAITSYEQSLKLVPDKALEEHVKMLRAQVTKENDKKVSADKLWQDGTALFNQGRPADALAKFKESLAYWQDATRTKYVQDLEGRRAQAQTLRDQGAQLQQQNRLQDAVAKYNQSLQLWPDSLLADHIKALEAKTAKDNEQKNTADKLWKEGTDVLNQGNPSEALAKFKESLKYSSSPDRVKYVQDLEARKTQAEKLRSEGASLQSQGKLQEAIGKYKESLKYWPDPVLVEHIAKIEAEMKKQQTPVPPASGPVDGTWEVSFNNYKGKMELQRSGSGWSGRIWLDAHQRWEQLTNVSYSSSTGRMEFTRPISGATQRYSGALSAERMEGTFTQENSSTKYTWWAKRTQAGTDKPVGSNATTGTSQSVVSPVQPGLSLDGTYSGPISGAASGTIQITVAGDRATGTINGTYQGDRFNGSWTGTVSKATGEVQGALKGDISGYAFTGSIAGRIQGVQATGTWNAKNQYGNPTGTWQAARGGGASSTGTSTGTGSAPQGKTSVMAELTNSSKMNAHIFTEGETFSPSNRLAPGEKRKVSVQMAPNGTVTFKAGRDGQVMATKRWDGEPGNPNRVPVVIFDDTNPFDKLTVATGLR